jgi:hypothetical protein
MFYGTQVTNLSEEPPASIFYSVDGASRFLRNFGISLRKYMALHPRTKTFLNCIQTGL